MIHERGCPAASGIERDVTGMPPLCICHELRAAYQRGRADEQAKFAKWTNAAIDDSERAKEYQRGCEDAAQAVEAAWFGGLNLHGRDCDCEWCLDTARVLRAAARGDSE